MIEGKFDLVFRGQTIKSLDVEEVKANLVSLFKTTPEAIEKLFTGNEVPVRRDLDYSTAMKYQSALKKAGALALIKEVESFSESTPQQSSQGKASFGVVQSENPTANVKPASYPKPPSSSTETIAVSTSRASADGDSLTVAEVGTQLLPNKVYEKREIDTSELSLAASGERIMPAKAPDNTPPPSIDHLSLE
ncbi:MAG: hypothetical protein L3J46_05940 [Kangiellaceae bacterium]|nr:hypothetical protein [Kangiellaceae bacterium]